VIAAALAWLVGNRGVLAFAKCAAIGVTILLFLLLIRRTGERGGRMAERLDTVMRSNDIQRKMLDAAARRPRDRDELAKRLRRGEF
jgi:hypothetical protein